MRSHSYVNHRDQQFPRSPIRPQSKSQESTSRPIVVQVDVKSDLKFWVFQNDGRPIFVPSCPAMEFYSGCEILRARSGVGQEFNLIDLNGICELHQFSTRKGKLVLDLKSRPNEFALAPRGMFGDVVAQLARGDFSAMRQPSQTMSRVEQAAEFSRMCCRNQFEFEVIAQLIFVALIEIPLEAEENCLATVENIGLACLHFARSRPYLSMFVDIVERSFPNWANTQRKLFGLGEEGDDGVKEATRDSSLNSALADADDEDIGEENVDAEEMTRRAAPVGEDEAVWISDEKSDEKKELTIWFEENDVLVKEVQKYLQEKVGVTKVKDLMKVTREDFANLYNGLSNMWKNDVMAKKYVTHLNNVVSSVVSSVEAVPEYEQYQSQSDRHRWANSFTPCVEPRSAYSDGRRRHVDRVVASNGMNGHSGATWNWRTHEIGNNTWNGSGASKTIFNGSSINGSTITMS